MIVLIRWKNIIEVTWCHRNKAGLRLARIKKDFERRTSICFAKLQFASWCSFFVVLFWERLYWIRLNVQSHWLWCNFQVAEVLATVIKKEKEDETEKKGESRFSRLCPRQTLSILAPTVFLVEVSVLLRSDSRRVLALVILSNSGQRFSSFFKRSFVGLDIISAYTTCISAVKPVTNAVREVFTSLHSTCFTCLNQTWDMTFFWFQYEDCFPKSY